LWIRRRRRDADNQEAAREEFGPHAGVMAPVAPSPLRRRFGGRRGLAPSPQSLVQSHLDVRSP
jgi:hypothetical protein